MPETLEGTLAAEVQTKAPITFEIEGVTYSVPNPLQWQTWLWIWENFAARGERIGLDGLTPEQAGTLAMVRSMAAWTEDILAIATGLKREALDGLKPDVLEGVCASLLVQLEGELRDAAPFTTVNVVRAAKVFGRMNRILHAGRKGSTTGSPQAPSSAKSAEVAGPK